MFTLNSKSYETDRETLEILRPMVASFHAGAVQMKTAIAAIMSLGLKSGRIVELERTAA